MAFAPDPVRSDVAAFLVTVNNVPEGPGPGDLGAAAMREIMTGLAAMADAPMRDTVVIRDFSVPGEDGTDVPLRLFDHQVDRRGGPVVLFFHGGGFVVGDLDSYGSICAEIAWQIKLPVVAVDYRLAPEHPWPAAPEDCEAAARFLAGGHDGVLELLGFAPAGLVLSGESAGALLAIVTALALQAVPAGVPVLACSLSYPWVEPQNTTQESYSQFAKGHLVTADALEWFGECFALDPGHWHSHLLTADYTNFPPTAVMTAGLDPLRDQGRELAGRLSAAGVITIFREAVGNVHAFLGIRGAVQSSVVDMSLGLADLRYLLQPNI